LVAKRIYTPVVAKNVVAKMVAKPVGVEDIGTEVVCPKCGARGRVAVERVTAGGKTYLYLSVRHVLGHAKAKRCLLRRLTDE